MAVFAKGRNDIASGQAGGQSRISKISRNYITFEFVIRTARVYVSPNKIAKFITFQ